MARTVFHFTSATSFALFLATCVLWIRSYSARDAVEFGQSPRWEIASSGGRFWLADDPEQRRRHAKARANDDAVLADALRFRAVYDQLRTDNEAERVARQREGRWGRSPEITARYENLGTQMDALMDRQQTADRLLKAAPAVTTPIHSTAHGNVVAAFIPLPLMWLAIMVHRSWQRRTRILFGQCTSCGYDLRASPLQCPECGAIAPPSACPESRE